MAKYWFGELLQRSGQQGSERDCGMNMVLVIDNDKELCAFMKKCIEREKLTAVAASDGIEL